MRKCFDDLYPNYAGWLEIHPLDSIRRVRPAPALRRHVEVVSACGLRPDKSWDPDAKYDPGRINVRISPRDVGLTPPEGAVLKFREIVDPRFTKPKSVIFHKVELDSCDPTELSVRVLVTQGGAFKASYLTWWEDGQGAKPSACTNKVRTQRTGPRTMRPVDGDDAELELQDK
jgi:hypothetical protein